MRLVTIVTIMDNDGMKGFYYTMDSISIIIEILVSLPSMISVGESDDIVLVCAVMSSMAPISREYNIHLATSDGSGKEVYIMHTAIIILYVFSHSRFRLHRYIIYRSIHIWVNFW